MPTLMDRAGRKQPRPLPAPETKMMALEEAFGDDEDVELESRPTLLPFQLPDMAVPDPLLGPGEELPPPMPSPERPTVALQVFVEEEGLDLEDGGAGRGRTDPVLPARPRRTTGNLNVGPLRSSGALPAGPLRKSGSLPAEPLRRSGSLPAGPRRKSGSLPADPLRRSSALPASPVRKPEKK
jgi:hypothetical protein